MHSGIKRKYWSHLVQEKIFAQGGNLHFLLYPQAIACLYECHEKALWVRSEAWRWRECISNPIYLPVCSGGKATSCPLFHIMTSAKEKRKTFASAAQLLYLEGDWIQKAHPSDQSATITFRQRSVCFCPRPFYLKYLQWRTSPSAAKTSLKSSAM